jgi:hypothetical protein
VRQWQLAEVLQFAACAAATDLKPTQRSLLQAWISCCLEQGLELDGPAGEAARRWTSQPALARISSVSDPGAAAAGLPHILLRAPSNIEQTVQADAGEFTAVVSSSQHEPP